MEKERIVIDTNVLVRATFEDYEDHQKKSRHINDL